jgi:nucleotide-binding universal stress UspA family protein
VPVLVHRPVDIAPDGPAPPPVLVGVTGTPKDEPVIGFAFEEASLRGTTLHAMHVWSEPADAELPDIHAEVRGFSQAHEEAERMLSETLAGWSDKYPEVPVSRTVRHSLDAAVALTAASWSAQLAVVGASEDSLLAHVLSASVSHTLAHRAGCPVAVVHERQS